MRVSRRVGWGRNGLMVWVGIALLLCLLPPSFARESAAAPPPVLVVDMQGASPAELLQAVSLQALANRPPRPPGVFLITRDQDEEWLSYALRILKRPAQRVSLAELLAREKGLATGQVLCDPEVPQSVGLAATAAGIEGAVISDADLGLPTLHDFRPGSAEAVWQSSEAAYRWALEHLFPKCAKSGAALLPMPAGDPFLDYALQQRLFVMQAPSAGSVPVEGSALCDLLFRLPPGALVYGRLPQGASRLPARYSLGMATVSDTANLSFLSRVTAVPSFSQHIGYLEPANVRYLTLIFDCSDVDFAVNEMEKRWRDGERGMLPLGWALPARLAELAPPVLHRFYGEAYRSGLDQFVLGPSGAAEMDISAARTPYPFYDATAKAARRLDARVALFDASAGTQELDIFVPQFIGETGMRGVFVTGARPFRPFRYSGAVVIPAPRVSSLKEAVHYLDNLPPEYGFAALCLDPHTLTPADAAHLAAYLGSRFTIVGPEEMMELARVSNPSLSSKGTVSVTSVKYPEKPRPDEPLPIKARVEAPSGVASLAVVYKPVSGRVAFLRPMESVEGGFRAELPPLYCGGEFSFRLFAVDKEGRASWSPPWTEKIPRQDGDGDGLSDAEERYLLTDPDNPDTDGDGLRDGNDLAPDHPDRIVQCYLGPIEPPSDHPYLMSATGTDPQAADSGRILRPGETALYWLPTAGMAPNTNFSVLLKGSGPAELSLLAQAPSQPDERAERATLSGRWRSPDLSSSDYPEGVFLRISCPEGVSGESLVIEAVSLVSPESAPSIARPAAAPDPLGPEQPVFISAQAFAPAGIEDVMVSYRVNGGGIVSFPMKALAETQTYRARLPRFSNRDRVEWWITARDADGRRAVTPPALIVVGSWARETASLVATREFTGDWRPDTIAFGGGRLTARSADADGLVDEGPVNLTGGNYAVWVLGGGRGRGLAVYVKDKRIGAIDPDAPDGWQLVGRVRLEVGHYRVRIVSEPGSAPSAAAARYAAVVFTADRTFRPPGHYLLDVFNSLSLLYPRPGQTVSGAVKLLATGSGSITGVQFYLDGEPLRRAFGPPFSLELSTDRYGNGRHVLKLEGLDRAGRTGLTVEAPIFISNHTPGR